MEVIVCGQARSILRSCGGLREKLPLGGGGGDF